MVRESDAWADEPASGMWSSNGRTRRECVDGLVLGRALSVNSDEVGVRGCVDVTGLGVDLGPLWVVSWSPCRCRAVVVDVGLFCGFLGCLCRGGVEAAVMLVLLRSLVLPL